MGGKITFDPGFEAGQRLGERVFEHHQNLALPGIRQRVFQDRVGRIENVHGEKDAQLPADLNLALNQIHRIQSGASDGAFRVLFGKSKNPPGANREGVLRFSGYFFIAWSVGIRIP